MQAPKKKDDDSTEKFINGVFIFVTVMILSSIMWADEHDVYSYYQNLTIASFSIAIVILHIYHEIKNNIENGFPISKPIIGIYISCGILCMFCCALPIGFYFLLNKSTFLTKHMLENENWWICLLTFFPTLYTIWWGYIYPFITDISGKYKNIHLEERPQ